jgi:hypothetical protein
MKKMTLNQLVSELTNKGFSPKVRQRDFIHLDDVDSYYTIQPGIIKQYDGFGKLAERTFNDVKGFWASLQELMTRNPVREISYANI